MSDTKKTILVVDDEPDMVEFLVTFFQDNGFNVLTASDGKECLEKVKDVRPDLITLDITMPEESGVRAFRNIQESPDTKDIPVVIITGIAKDFRQFIHSRKKVEPPAAYFEKPIDKDALLNKVKEILA
ncbi:response regulator [candidate division CSSED10-310 bacterium]|uniref:Response regulator n=1 Tax=candidate division CSSED10-310 bacterium TaxID=2855610 RepID=A0ABV6Z2Z0_UNCC1